MPNKHQLIHAALGAIIVYDAVVHFRNKTRFEELLEQKNLSDKQVSYLVHMLEERQIVPTEFDLFAMNHLI